MKHFRVPLSIAAGFCAGIIGCSSSPDTPQTTPESTVEPLVAEKDWRDAAILYSAEDIWLGHALRSIGRLSGGGIVLMGGLERRLLESCAYDRVPLSDAIADLAMQTGLATQTTADYHFIYPTGYEALLDVSVDGDLPETLRDVEGDAVFAAGTPLFTVFRLLSAGFGITIVADNAIASAQSGEIILGDVGMKAMIASALKSARIAPGSYEFRIRDNYVFIHAPRQSPIPETYLLSAELEPVALQRAVDLDLPQPPMENDVIDIDMGAAPLDAVLATLSVQLGTRVTIEPVMANIPVNPVSMRGVTIQEAMDLLIAQWLADDIAYTFDGDTIRIQTR